MGFTSDHEVLTENRGWVPIAEISLADLVIQREEDGTKNAVHPTKIIQQNYDGPMYEIEHRDDGRTIIVDANHFLLGHIQYGINNDYGGPVKVFPVEKVYNYYVENDVKAEKDKWGFEDATIIITLTVSDGYDVVGLYDINKLESNPDPQKMVYSICVPSSVFLVRRTDSPSAYWTCSPK